MDRRPLGRHPFAVAPIGFGTFKIGRNQGIKYAAGYELPDDAAVQRLIDGALALGVDLFDTAPAYGVAEERLGAALGARRRDVFLSTKVGEEFAGGASRYDFTSAAVTASLERSLRRLRTDAVDLTLVHAHRDDGAILDDGEVVDALHALRDRGLTRLIGWSGKTVAAARRALAWADVLMVEYHVDDVSHAAVLDEAAACGAGVLVKKGLASGRLPAAEAIPFVLRHPAVSCLVIGGLSLAHLADNVRIADGR